MGGCILMRAIVLCRAAKSKGIPDDSTAETWPSQARDRAARAARLGKAS